MAALASTTALDSNILDVLQEAVSTLETGKWDYCRKIIARNSTLYFFQEPTIEKRIVVKWHNDIRHLEQEVSILKYLHYDREDMLQILFAKIENGSVRDPSIPFIALTAFTDRGPPLNVWKEEYLPKKHNEQKLQFLHNFLVQAVRAVTFLHERDCIHNLLEPNNLCILGTLDNFHLTLTSFGAAMSPNTCKLPECHPGYTAPEGLLTYHRNLGADIYSLGVIAAEVIIGDFFLHIEKREERIVHTPGNIFFAIASLEARGHPIPQKMIDDALETNESHALITLLEGTKISKRILPSKYFKPLTTHLQNFVEMMPTSCKAQAITITQAIPKMVQVNPEWRIVEDELLTLLHPPEEEKE